MKPPTTIAAPVSGCGACSDLSAGEYKLTVPISLLIGPIAAGAFELRITFIKTSYSHSLLHGMHIHRNILRYRLDPICEIAQLNMKDEQLKKQMLPSIYCFDLFPRIQGMSHLSPRGIAAK